MKRRFFTRKFNSCPFNRLILLSTIFASDPSSLRGAEETSGTLEQLSVYAADGATSRTLRRSENSSKEGYVWGDSDVREAEIKRTSRIKALLRDVIVESQGLSDNDRSSTSYVEQYLTVLDYVGDESLAAAWSETAEVDLTKLKEPTREGWERYDALLKERQQAQERRIKEEKEMILKLAELQNEEEKLRKMEEQTRLLQSQLGELDRLNQQMLDVRDRLSRMEGDLPPSGAIE